MTLPSSPDSVSVLTAVSQAVERMKVVLFRPFDVYRWLAIGFCAWLATLGEAFGGGGGGGGRWQAGGDRGRWRGEWERGVEYVRDHFAWILLVVVAVVVVVVVVSVVVLWLSSRGRFMFLHNVALNRADVVHPWQAYRAHGNSLFLFRLAVGLCGFCLIAPFLAALGWAVARMIRVEAVIPGPLLVAVGAAAAVFGLALALALIGKFTKDFVVPIMWLRQARCWNAWGEFLGLLSANLGGFVLYILFHILLTVGIGMAVFLVILLTCCLAGCLLAIPYLGTVLFLPVLVFLRAFSAHYLAQYGPAYDVFRGAGGEAGTPTTITPN